MLAYGMEIVISREQAENYFLRNEGNGWFDTKHKPIRNWKKAMAGYFKKIEESNTDDGYYSTPKPEPIPMPPNLKQAEGEKLDVEQQEATEITKHPKHNVT